jgi:DNA repair exonuclease SbcCD ATPase subunit
MIEDIRTHVAERKDYLSSTLRECQDNKISCSTLLATARNSRKVLEDKLNSLGDVQSKKDKLQEHFELLEGLKQSVIKYRADYSEADEQVRHTQDDYNSLESSQNNELLVIKNEYAERSGVVQADIAALNATINALQRNISNAKKVTDVCPTCGQKLPGVYVPNTQEDEEELARLQDRVKELSCKQQQLYEEYNVLKWTEVEAKYKSRLREIKDALMSQVAHRNEVNNLKEKAEQAIKTGELEVIRIQTEIEHHEAIKKDTITEIEKCDESILHLELQYKSLEEEETSINQHIAVINKFETIIKRDFRGYLLQDIIVYIDKRAKEYSKVIFGTELIDFALDGNNISISYNGKSYEALSGGERQKVDIIVQFAIRDVLCAYTNFHTNIIVLDEIFDNLDEIGSRRVIDLISHQLTDISAIFIISHHAKELNLPYDRELVVRKDENGVSNLV